MRRSYILAQDHVGPALDRVFRAAAAQLTASHTLNDFLVARPPPDGTAAAPDVTELRGAVRDDLIIRVNQRLAALSVRRCRVGRRGATDRPHGLAPPRSQGRVRRRAHRDPGCRAGCGRRPHRCRAPPPGRIARARSAAQRRAGRRERKSVGCAGCHGPHRGSADPGDTAEPRHSGAAGLPHPIGRISCDAPAPSPWSMGRMAGASSCPGGAP